jgi:photosystem II stability/assembly factor-like uncharacterized protein
MCCSFFEEYLETKFSLAIGPGTLTVHKGETANATVTVTRAVRADGSFYSEEIELSLGAKRSTENTWMSLGNDGVFGSRIRFEMGYPGLSYDGRQVQDVPLSLAVLYESTEDSADYDLLVHTRPRGQPIVGVQSNILRLQVRPGSRGATLFTLTLLSDTLSAYPGQAAPAHSDIRIEWVNNLFTGDVILTVEPSSYPGISPMVPQRVGYFTPVQHEPFNIFVDQSAAYGSYPIVVRGNGGGYEARDSLVLVVRAQSSNAQWTEYRATVGDIFRAVAFADLTAGVVVGDGGVVLRTTDSGTTWESGVSGTTRDLLGVDAIDAARFLACGENGTVRRSTDAGLSWTPAEAVPPSDDLNAVTFIDSQTGVIAGNSGTVLWTINGGSTWEARGFIPQTFNADAIGFWDALNLLIVGYDRVSQVGEIWRTTNAGTSWTRVFIGPQNSWFDGVSCLTPGAAIAVGSAGNSRKSTDGGMTWGEPIASLTTRDFEAVSFATEFVGTAVGNAVSGISLIRRTTDGGNQWFFEDSEGVQASLFGVHMVTPEVGFAVGESRRILRRQPSSRLMSRGTR